MRKILILAVAAVLLLAGCVDKKEAQKDEPQQEAIETSSETQPQQSSEPANEQSAEPQASEGEQEVGSTEETLDELGDLLEELQDSDFADIEFAE